MIYPVIFDLDGTLIDSLPNIAEAGNRLLKAHGLTPRETARFAPYVGHGEGVFIERLIADSDLDGSAAELLPEFIEHYISVGAKTRMMPGARTALEALQQRGVPLGLVTNKPAAPLGAVIEKLGLGPVFDCIVAGDDLAQRKPHPAPLLHCMGELGADRCLFVGDSMVDARTARAAEQPFALYTKGIRTEPISALSHTWAFDDFGAGFDAVYGAFAG
ncbi:HAD-IA family hydrolase [Alphaproteobacteria bacterium KMM 3653]|uniref:phosphoglycolate phosphatase n=1 Tax=Harenicola maris TaxID=2841044 RepID=A0AAP2CQ90_9RHOB|nr:HAD-IA family hydrolase [Harenicola maris]